MLTSCSWNSHSSFFFFLVCLFPFLVFSCFFSFSLCCVVGQLREHCRVWFGSGCMI